MANKDKVSKFTPLKILVIALILLAVCLVAYTIYDNNQDDSSSRQSQDTKVEDVPEIKSDNDLDDAEKILDDTTVESDQDNQQLDSELNSL